MRFIIMALLLITELATAGSNTIVTVGPESDPDCDYNSISAVSFNEPPSDGLEIRVSKNYSLDSFQVIGARNTTIMGGFDNCLDTTPSGRTELDGFGFNGAIFLVSDSELTGGDQNVLSLVDLEISGGNSGVSGGVMSLTGSWGLEMVNVYLHDNESTKDGGAIFVEPSTNNLVTIPEVYIYGNSVINNNTADNGGAIACDGLGLVTVFETQILGNDALSNGGAVYVNDGCVFQQSGGGPLHGIYLNEASFWGGGIYANNNAEVWIVSNSIFSVGWAVVFSNSAENGGGIAVAGGASLIARDAIINGNSATSTGGGIRSSSGHVTIERTLPGAQCHTEDRCSTVSENTVTGVDPTFSGGGAIATFGGSLIIRGTYLEGNNALFGSAIRARFMPLDGSLDAQLSMVGNVIAGNFNAPQVVYLDETSADIGFSTFVDNEDMLQVIEMAYPTTFTDNHQVRIIGSIFEQPGTTVASAKLTTTEGPAPIGDCNRNEVDSTGDLIGQPRSSTFMVMFEDQMAGDYRLQDSSFYVDFCDDSFLASGSDYSADGLPRPIDNALSDFNGIYDLGGLERRGLDLIFEDDFE